MGLNHRTAGERTRADKSVLSFAGQVAGAEGLSVSGSDFLIEDVAIEDTVGDALKVNEGNNIVIRRVRTEWTNGPDVNNGAYGIYPVQTTNVLVEGSVAIAASDAGIYVGQSRDVIVRNNEARDNIIEPRREAAQSTLRSTAPPAPANTPRTAPPAHRQPAAEL